MNLDNRENYLKEQVLLRRLPISKLEKLVGEMHKIRYDENDIRIDAYYRLAVTVLLDRTRIGKSLIYHMKNFIGFMLIFFVSLLYKQ